MKQTAVEWLVEQLSTNLSILRDYLKDNPHLFEQAKEMEKEQIENAFEAAEKDCGRDFLHGDLYYNETFKNTEQ